MQSFSHINHIIIADITNRLLSEMLASVLVASGCYSTVSVQDVEAITRDDSRETDGYCIVIFLFCEDDKKIISLINNNVPQHIPLLIIYIHDAKITSIKELIAVKRKIGIVSGSVSLDELHAYIRGLHNNDDEKWLLSDDIQYRLLENFLKHERNKYGAAGFTSVEQQIIRLAGMGYSIQQMAEKLGLSPNTIAAYRSRLLKKTGMRSMSQLLAQHKAII